jgi:hypothetical protein
MIKELIVTWQNPTSRNWIPIGRLQYKNSKYIFNYTYEAKQERDFVPFRSMNNLDDSYQSDELFPFFANRLLPKSRPEYGDYLSWLNFKEDKIDPLEELARTNGIKATDSLQLFPTPEKTDGMYEVTFFSHGIRYLPESYIDRISHLNYGSNLYLMKDIQNKFDPNALVLRTDDPTEIVGYCPIFFVYDFVKLLDKNGPGNVHVSVVKVNLNSPFQFRLLCKLSTAWPSDFVPFQDKVFQTVERLQEC